VRGTNPSAGFLSRLQRRQRWSLAFILCGIFLLVYVASQYAFMYQEQRRLTREWEQQNQPAGHGGTATPASHDGLTRISIPRISLDAVVVEGTSPHELLIGPGHLKDSPEPGDPGNVVVTAHRDTFFRHIYELNKGDVIELRRDGNTYRYEVTGKRVVDPADVSVIQPSQDARLTLITCYPTYYVGPAPERLVVMSKLVENGANQPTRALGAGTTQ
jgi:LPXTG-site transpeptidase (sortase) family protein